MTQTMKVPGGTVTYEPDRVSKYEKKAHPGSMVGRLTAQSYDEMQAIMAMSNFTVTHVAARGLTGGYRLSFTSCYKASGGVRPESENRQYADLLKRLTRATNRKWERSDLVDAYWEWDNPDDIRVRRA